MAGMKLNPHLSFGGQCEAAVRFYEQILGGQIVTMLKYGDSPMADPAKPEMRDKILHATMKLGESTLVGADVEPGQYTPPKGFHLLLGIADPAEAERVFHALAENGKVIMPIQKTFWALRFGVLVDRFGVPWEINCEQTA